MILTELFPNILLSFLAYAVCAGVITSAAVGMEHLSHDNSHMWRGDCDPLRCSKSLVSDVNGIFHKWSTMSWLMSGRYECDMI